MDLGLKGKAAVITGATQGIGLAVAEGLAREGVALLLCARGKERLLEVGKRLTEQFKIQVKGVCADVTNPAHIESLGIAADKEFGGVDIMINNAGTGSEETIMDAADEKWQSYWDLHVMAAVRMSRTMVPFMRARGGGVIINNASICAKQPLYYEPIYNVTKSALVMFSKCLASELIKDNIRVNTINPGLVLTPDWRNTARILGEKEGITAEDYLDRIAKQNTPIGRFATPEELANFFVFLCSPRASYCVGSTYYVDGGWLRTIN
jgi:NAD(P)-dependent dehydrogenase (short-subunit alcohol dehydrogenase family)